MVACFWPLLLCNNYLQKFSEIVESFNLTLFSVLTRLDGGAKHVYCVRLGSSQAHEKEEVAQGRGYSLFSEVCLFRLLQLFTEK